MPEQERLEKLTTDASSLLWRGFTSTRTIEEDAASAYAEWKGGLQREVVLASRFAPKKTQRDAYYRVWVEFEKLIRRMHAMVNTPEDSSRRDEVIDRYQRAYGETSYALDGLVQALGEPERVDRAAYTLSLRSDSEDGNRASTSFPSGASVMSLKP